MRVAWALGDAPAGPAWSPGGAYETADGYYAYVSMLFGHGNHNGAKANGVQQLTVNFGEYHYAYVYVPTASPEPVNGWPAVVWLHPFR